MREALSEWMDPLLLSPEEMGLMTDLYQLTMWAAYRRHRPKVRGVFELWFRDLPPNRNFLLFAGLAPALAYLQQLRFAPQQVEQLRRLPALAGLEEDFFRSLAEFRFACDVWAVPEGSVVFAGEPVLRVEGPIEQAQLVETYLLSVISFSTLIASKAARVRLAAGEARVVDFGSRRAHGPLAACWAARAAYLAGLDATSNVWAALRLNIPESGTMAHSFVLSFPEEEAAFQAFAETFPERTVLLVDTFDPLVAVERAARDPALQFLGVRLDSGDLATLAQEVREILNRHGRNQVKIIASGDLDEYRIEALRQAGAPIDAFGVGTRLVTSNDAPTLQGVYKLVEVHEPGMTPRPVAKSSAGKETYPGAKQVYRQYDAQGQLVADWVLPHRVPPPQGFFEPLLTPVMRQGRLVDPLPSLEEARAYASQQLARLPQFLRQLHGEGVYPVLVQGGAGGDPREGAE
ncbi:MAG: nicotinate phosphoribosyltransferase [Thermoanaerobaculum sp.]|nr:nicotinate phosphoribosyltransferase [Thermoanaerobaculum sp.]MDW7966988.1 nicotinate phosphoribosyltransferase [Thermoanaerobaculum sp.]